MTTPQRISLIYLYLVPPVVAAIGFGIGHVNVVLYLCGWLVNTVLMLMAVWQLIKHQTNLKDNIYHGYTGAAFLLVIPWMLFPIFAGMGPPPVTLPGWLATATEQQLRYNILIIGGIIALMGFALLKVRLGNRGETFYSTLGFTTVSVAIPLFILNMIFWGYYLTDAFKFFSTLPPGKRPEWYPPIKSVFYAISVVEVFLIYASTALFAIALSKVGILSSQSKRWYVFIALTGMILVVLPPSVPVPLSVASYLAAIPAIPFIMPYLIGLRLLRID